MMAVGIGLFALVATLTPASWPQRALAASLTWDGGGADNNWSTCANWTTDICPVAGDTVTFNATSTKDSTVDDGFGGTITNLNINSGYTGTVSLARSLIVSTAFSQAAGGFVASNQLLDMNNSFTLSAGTFTASSGTTTLAGNMTISGSPTFNNNGGTWTFDGSATATLSCNNVSFNLVAFAHTGSVTKTVNSNCSLPLGANPTVGADLNADLTLNGVLSGSGTITVGTQGSGNLLTLNSGSSLSGFNGLAAGALTISGATYNFGSYTSFDINGVFTLSSAAVFTAPSGTMTVQTNFTLNSGTTFNANGGTLTLDGASTGTLTCNNATFNLVTFTHTGNVGKTVNSDCNLPLGNDPTIGGDSSADFILNGTLSGTGILKMGAQSSGNNFTINSTGGFSGFNGLNAGILTISGATANFGSYSTFTVASTYTQTGGTITVPNGADFNGTFTLSSSGVFNAPSSTMTVANTFTLNSGTTFNHNNGTLTFDGGSGGTLTCSNATFNLVTIAHTGNNTKIVSSDCNLPLGNNPTAGADLNADLTLNGTFSGSGTLALGTQSTGNVFTVNSGASLSGFTGLAAGMMTVATTLNLGSYSTFVVTNTYTQNGGTVTVPNGADFHGFVSNSGATFNAPSGVMTVSSTFTINAGATFNHNNGTLTFDGTLSSSIACNNTTFNLVVIANTAGSKTVNSDCNLPLGNNPTLTRSVTLNGTLSGGGTITTVSGGTTLNTGYVLSGFTGLNAGNLIIAAANADFSGFTLLDMVGFFTINSGATFIAPPGTMTLLGALTISSGGTFVANGGTLTFDGANTGSHTFSCGNAVFNHVTFEKSGTSTVTFTVSNDCNFPLGANPTVQLGDNHTLSLNGTLSGSGTLTTAGTLNLSNGFSLSGFDGLITDNLTVQTAADFSAYSTFTITGNYLQTAGTFTAPANANFDGDFRVSNPAIFNAPSGSMSVAGDFIQSQEGNLSLPGTSGNYASTPDTSALDITGDIDIRVKVAMDDWTPSAVQDLLAKYDSPANQRGYLLQLDVAGSLILWLSSTGAASGSSTSSVPTGMVGGTVKWVRATYRMSDRRVQFFLSDDGVSWSQLGTDLTHSMTSIFSNTAPLVIGARSDLTEYAAGKFYRTQVRNNILDDGTGIVFDTDFTNHADETTSFTESSSNAATVTINGPDAHIYGTGIATFNHNNGTVILDGSNQVIQGTTFYNLTKTVAAAATLTLPAGITETIVGALTLKGASGQLLSLVSSTPGTQWQINPQGTRDVSYAAVTDSQNTNASAIVACNSTDNGNNSGWSFNPASCIPTLPPSGGTGGTSGSSQTPASTTSGFGGSLSGEEVAQGTTSQEVSVSTSRSSESETAGTAVTQSEDGGLPLWLWFILWLILSGGLLALAIRRHRRQRVGLPAPAPRLNPLINTPTSQANEVAENKPVENSVYYPKDDLNSNT